MNLCTDRPATHMTDLPYLVRRVLRIVDRHQVIKAIELEREADLDHGISTETSLLIMRRLIDRNQDGTYSITPAGAECVRQHSNSQRSTPRGSGGLYQGLAA